MAIRFVYANEEKSDWLSVGEDKDVCFVKMSGVSETITADEFGVFVYSAHAARVELVLNNYSANTALRNDILGIEYADNNDIDFILVPWDTDGDFTNDYQHNVVEDSGKLSIVIAEE